MIPLISLLDADVPKRLHDLDGPWDRAMMAACQQFTLLTAAEKAEVRAAIGLDRSWVIIGWAERMASLAVRKQLPELLALALIALSLFDSSKVDSRDAQVVYALLTRAAVRLGVPPAFLQRAAAEHTDQPGGTWLLTYAPDPAVSLPPTYDEIGEGEAFAYRRRKGPDPRVTLRHLMQ